MGYWNVNFTDGTSDDFGKKAEYVREARIDGFLAFDFVDKFRYAVALVPKSQIKYLEYIED